MGVASVLGAASGLFGGGGGGLTDAGLNDGRQILDQKLATGAFSIGGDASQEPVFTGSLGMDGLGFSGGNSSTMLIIAGAVVLIFFFKGR